MRRKGHAISSDSEVGSSRRKDKKVSDFEDSEDDGSEPVKRKRKKNKKIDEDSEASTDSNEGYHPYLPNSEILHFFDAWGKPICLFH